MVEYNGLTGWTVDGHEYEAILPPPELNQIVLERIHEFDYGGGVTGIHFSPNDHYLALVTGFAHLYVLDTASFDIVIDIDFYDEADASRQRSLTDIVWHPDSEKLAVLLSDDAQMRMLRIPEETEALRVSNTHIHEDTDEIAFPAAISFTPDGEQIVTFGQDGFVRLWDSNNGDLHTVIYQAPYETSSRHMRSIVAGDLVVSPDNSLTYIFRNSLIFRWDIANNVALLSPPVLNMSESCLGHQPTNLAISSYGNSILYHANGVWIYDSETGNRDNIHPQIERYNMNNIALLPFGLLTIGLSDLRSESDLIEFFNFHTGDYLMTLEAPSMQLAFNRAGNYLVTGSFDDVIVIWEIQY